MQHTAAPWHIGMHPGPNIYGPVGELVADMTVPMLPNAEHRANARLIAAAPDLLQACIDMLNVGLSARADSVIWRDLRAAVEKATGAIPATLAQRATL